MKKVVKTYRLSHKRGGWSVDILKCDHAVLIPPGVMMRSAPERRCLQCVSEAQKKLAASRPAPVVKSPKKQMEDLVRNLGIDGVLELLAGKDAIRRARQRNMAKARAVRASKLHVLPEAVHNGIEVAV